MTGIARNAGGRYSNPDEVREDLGQSMSSNEENQEALWRRERARLPHCREAGDVCPDGGAPP